MTKQVKQDLVKQFVPIKDNNGMTIRWEEKVVLKDSVTRKPQPGGLAPDFKPEIV